MRIRTILSFSAAASVIAILSAAAPAYALTLDSGTANVTYTNAGGSGTAVLDTLPYLVMAPGSVFITYANGDVAPGPTTYNTTFSGVAGEGGTLTFAADDSGTASLNGHLIGTTGTSVYDTLFTFALPTADFVNGTNTLSFVVTNQSVGNNPTGLDFAVTAATPEPSSLILLGTGALGLAGALRRRLLA